MRARTTIGRLARGGRLAVVLLAAACGRRGGSAAPPVAPAPDSATGPTVSRLATVALPFGPDIVTVSGRSDQRVEVVLSGARQMTLAFHPLSVDEFLKTGVPLVERRRRRRERDGIVRALIDEPGGDGGALSLSRRVRGRAVTYRLVFADNVGGGFPVTVGQAEARAVLGAMRDAAVAIRPPTPAPATDARGARRPSGARRPARSAPSRPPPPAPPAPARQRTR